MLLALLTLAALAQEPAAPVQVLLLGDSADERLDDARQRIRTEDYQGARILVQQVLDLAESHHEEATYLLGVTWELDSQPARALQVYESALERWPEGELADSLRFRCAEATATLGDPKRALALLRQVEEVPDPASQLKVELVQGIWLVQAKRERRGLKLLAQALASADPSQMSFYQAKARATVAATMLDDAAELSLDTRQRRQVRHLEQRAVLIEEAFDQVKAIAALQEPEWLLEGMLLMGRAYESLGDDLLTSREPRGLTEDQLVIYREGVAEKVVTVWVRAQRYYAQGLQYATQLDWRSRRVGELQRAYDAVVPKLEGA